MNKLCPTCLGTKWRDDTHLCGTCNGGGVVKMEKVIEQIKKKVSDLVADAKTAEDILRLANTLITLSNIKTKE